MSFKSAGSDRIAKNVFPLHEERIFRSLLEL